MAACAMPVPNSQYRMNVGPIVEATMVKGRLGRPSRSRRPAGGARRARSGEVEEYFAETPSPGDTFLLPGEVLTFHGTHRGCGPASRGLADGDRSEDYPAMPGANSSLSTYLPAAGARAIWPIRGLARLPEQLVALLDLQKVRSRLAGPGTTCWVETFYARGGAPIVRGLCLQGRSRIRLLGNAGSRAG